MNLWVVSLRTGSESRSAVLFNIEMTCARRLNSEPFIFTEKPIYFYIFFRAYILRAMLRLPSHKSNAAHIEKIQSPRR